MTAAEAPASILIVRLSSIGDVVHTIPALASLRRHFPQARIDWLVESRCRDVLVGNPYLDELLEVDTLGWRKRLTSPSMWSEALSKVRWLRARRYDVVFDLQGTLKSGVLAFLARGGRRIGFARGHLRESLSALFLSERLSPGENHRHMIDRHLHLLTAVGIRSYERVFPLKASRQAEERVERLLSEWGIPSFVAVNPGGSWVTKRWRPERFGELASRIAREHKLESLVFWGPGEDTIADRVARASNGAARVAPPTKLPEMMSYLRRARLFVGGDTGPLHIASALGIPVVGIYGPTDATRNGPFGAGDRVVSRQVPCGPCYKKRCPGFGTICLESIDVDEVMKAVSERLADPWPAGE